MIFNFREISCIYEILQILNKGKSKYSKMFKETKVSHTTLQRVLNELIEKKFVNRYDIGHKKVDYEITDKGRKLLMLLSELYGLVR